MGDPNPAQRGNKPAHSPPNALYREHGAAYSRWVTHFCGMGFRMSGKSLQTLSFLLLMALTIYVAGLGAV